MGFYFREEQNSMAFEIYGLISLKMLVLGLACELDHKWHVQTPIPAWGFPHTTRQFLDTSQVSYNSTKSRQRLPGDNIRSHR